MDLIFKEPTAFDQNWFAKSWGLGNVHNEPTYAHGEYGLVFYLTKFKPENIHPDNKEWTKFPHGAKIVRTSRNLLNDKIISRQISKTEMQRIVALAKEHGVRINYKTITHNENCYIKKAYLTNAEKVLSYLD